MKYLLPIFISLLHWAYCANVIAENLSTTNILQWPRMKADEFGCYLEKKFGVKDAKFNCSLKNYVNKGDPCVQTDAYYEGPEFPASKAKDISPLVDDIQLEWEHGDLRSVSLHFIRQVKEDEIKKIFALPSNFSFPDEYKNIMDISIQDCSKKGNCLIIDGFDHMGAGEADCSAHKK